ncbi:Signal transduction histidine kinase [Gracilibacillus orientalis]|uniref:histidine kinase n=1 Tax=Gracilibacillus orientalis TaxID=334253 RepID=A0A1I4ITV3_9BACI|nr:HAMP domain-containing sensor histidine kinase [Gracilibacillus orientalis]SFL57413.1 Signal transduction histidine kinase [Gracilibacillus orientalis]
MSIKKRLLLSNLAMIIIPVLGFLCIEILLGYLFFVMGNADPDGESLQRFMNYRMVAILLLLIITNGFLTYFVSRTIIKPIKRLNEAAEKIKQGDLESSIHSEKKDELGQLSNTFEEMRKSLIQANETQAKYEANRQELIASISHDLRTPVTSIKGYVQGVLDGVADSPEKLDYYMQTVYNKTDQLEKMVDELFIYSKLDLDRMPFQFDVFDIYAYLDDMVEELTFQYDEINFEFTPDWGSIFLVKADREQLHRAIMNIITNSVKYIDKKEPKIKIRITEQNEHVMIEIEDNGSGVNKSELPYIFDHFYRTDTSRNSTTGGSGLGLAIVKKIIEAHDGTVWADSEQGQGTTIYFQLKKGEQK